MTKRIVHDDGLSRQVPGPPPRQQPKRSEIVASEIDSGRRTAGRPTTAGRSTKAAWREQWEREHSAEIRDLHNRGLALLIIKRYVREAAGCLEYLMPSIEKLEPELLGDHCLGGVLKHLHAIELLATHADSDGCGLTSEIALQIEMQKLRGER